jgi:YgiT-type zinc finger domain-containing protein
MICVICKTGTPEPGRATFSSTKDTITVVVRDVPALVCPNCGEAYYDEATTDRLLEMATAMRAGAGRAPGGVALLEYAA